jgi:hypothetical protein
MRTRKNKRIDRMRRTVPRSAAYSGQTTMGWSSSSVVERGPSKCDVIFQVVGKSENISLDERLLPSQEGPCVLCDSYPPT